LTTWRETLRVRGGWAVLRASIHFFLQGGSYHAAALTYYAILSIFPAGALVYALLGVVGAESAIDSAVDALERRHVESQFVDAFRDTLRAAADQRSDDATIAIVVSTGAAVYVASRWIRGAARGLDAVLDRDPAAGAVRFLSQLRDTMVLVLLFVAALLLAFVGGGLARGLFGDALSTLWQIGAYVLAAGIAACAYAYVYAFVPSPPRARREALAAGAVLGTIIWGLATAGFLVFADLWPGYDTNYGVFATLIVGIIWLWLTNVSVLLGGAFALEWERGGGAGRARVWQDRA
jgi:membrane protein